MLNSLELMDETINRLSVGTMTLDDLEKS